MRHARRVAPSIAAAVAAITVSASAVSGSRAGATETVQRSGPAGLAFTDATGDANFVNNQGFEPLPIDDAGPDTRPASMGSADLVDARYETTYLTELDRDDSGRVTRVRRVPTGLRVYLRTAAPASPSFGPTVSMDLWTSVGGCPMIFRMRARGPLSSEGDPPQAAELRTRSTECPEGPKSYTEGIALELRGTTAVLEYPFTALQTPGGPVLRSGATIEPDPSGQGAHSASIHRMPNGLLVGGPFIDVAPPTASFEIGSDVPPDVDCIAIPLDPECTGQGPPPDTGEDLHSALLGSGEPERVAPAASVNLAEEFVVYSFRPDARWLTFEFDVAAARFEEAYVEVNLAARLIRDGQVQEEFLPISQSFADWKLIYGQTDDPYRTLSSIVQDTPYGVTFALPAEGLDRLTLLAGADVEWDADVALVLAMRGTDEPFIGEPFPDAFGAWMQSWTDGLRKVRLVADRWGHGVWLAARLAEYGGITPYDVRRGVEVEDDRDRVAGTAMAGTMRTSATLEATDPSLASANLFYAAQADQELAVEWRTPAEARRGTRSSTGTSGASLFATETDAGPGSYTFTLEVDSGPERSSSLGYIQDLWALDPSSLFPGLQASFFSDPSAEPVVLEPGEAAPGTAPSLVVAPARALGS